MSTVPDSQVRINSLQDRLPDYSTPVNIQEQSQPIHVTNINLTDEYQPIANSQSVPHPVENNTTNINLVRSHGKAALSSALGNSLRSPGPMGVSPNYLHEGSGLYFISNG